MHAFKWHMHAARKRIFLVAALGLAQTENLAITPGIPSPTGASSFPSHLGIQIMFQSIQLLQHLLDTLIPAELRRRGREAKHPRPHVRRSWDKGCAWSKRSDALCVCLQAWMQWPLSTHERGSPATGKCRTMTLGLKAPSPSKPHFSRVW